MPEYIMPGKQSPAFQSLDEFTQGYIEAMLWTEEEQLAEESEALEMSATAFITVDGKPTGETVHVPGNVSFELLAPKTLEKIIADCRKFQVSAHDLLEPVYISDTPYSPAQAGHDFWLTRNRSGVGFWDRGLGTIGDKLTAACQDGNDFPEVDVYLGDDGKIYAG